MPAKARSTRTKEQVFQKKADYLQKVISLLEEYPRFLIVTCDNIGSKLMQEIRLSLRKTNSVILMGKNTLIRKAIRTKIEEHPEWESILNCIKHNVGIVLTRGSLIELRTKLLENTVPAVAKSGSLAPDDVLLPKQITTLEPTKTSFFAALDIATKITKGCVEILNDVKLCERGRKVGSSEAALLQMLEIRPFTYGLKIVNCYDGSIFDPSFLDFTESDLFRSISVGIGQVAALSLALSYPTLPSFPHVIIAGFKNLVSVCLETNYSFKQAESLKNRVENPDAFKATVVTTTTTPTIKPEIKTPVVVTPEPVVEPDDDPDDGADIADFF
jgi:large subunit ribosomal protein LP0